MKKSKKSKAVAIATTQMTLWSPESLGLSERLTPVTTVRQSFNKENELVSETVRCLPMSSEDQPSIKSVTGFTGEMLKARTREATDDLKKALVHQAVAIGNDTHFTGVSMRVSRTGRVNLSFRRVTSMSIESCTEEELLARLEELRAAKANAQLPPATSKRGRKNGS
jgi:hypothetical protein